MSDDNDFDFKDYPLAQPQYIEYEPPNDVMVWNGGLSPGSHSLNYCFNYAPRSRYVFRNWICEVTKITMLTRKNPNSRIRNRSFGNRCRIISLRRVRSSRRTRIVVTIAKLGRHTRIRKNSTCRMLNIYRFTSRC